ncbi:hypothetical protein H696_02098 [Fonticula alba]|uniref:Uncharacterized protein n=1 Tax=Fonticula alba TaxID=691883 RepID=A0A058ZB51_FONAL|nr:hypothetical protein H696_02098 [Fonticula alba]KCV71148.1 hypothetical protein H696_02098 [Fonticula alba]|eukprot:XP_009494271.1 hypothetical protein H696_02098 [Fonticula alba]
MMLSHVLARGPVFATSRAAALAARASSASVARFSTSMPYDDDGDASRGGHGSHQHYEDDTLDRSIFDDPKQGDNSWTKNRPRKTDAPHGFGLGYGSRPHVGEISVQPAHAQTSFRRRSDSRRDAAPPRPEPTPVVKQHPVPMNEFEPDNSGNSVTSQASYYGILPDEVSTPAQDSPSHALDDTSAVSSDPLEAVLFSTNDFESPAEAERFFASLERDGIQLRNEFFSKFSASLAQLQQEYLDLAAALDGSVDPVHDPTLAPLRGRIRMVLIRSLQMSAYFYDREFISMIDSIIEKTHLTEDRLLMRLRLHSTTALQDPSMVVEATRLFQHAERNGLFEGPFFSRTDAASSLAKVYYRNRDFDQVVSILLKEKALSEKNLTLLMHICLLRRDYHSMWVLWDQLNLITAHLGGPDFVSFNYAIKCASMQQDPARASGLFLRMLNSCGLPPSSILLEIFTSFTRCQGAFSTVQEIAAHLRRHGTTITRDMALQMMESASRSSDFVGLVNLWNEYFTLTPSESDPRIPVDFVTLKALLESMSIHWMLPYMRSIRAKESSGDTKIPAMHHPLHFLEGLRQSLNDASFPISRSLLLLFAQVYSSMSRPDKALEVIFKDVNRMGAFPCSGMIESLLSAPGSPMSVYYESLALAMTHCTPLALAYPDSVVAMAFRHPTPGAIFRDVATYTKLLPTTLRNSRAGVPFFRAQPSLASNLVPLMESAGAQESPLRHELSSEYNNLFKWSPPGSLPVRAHTRFAPNRDRRHTK